MARNFVKIQRERRERKRPTISDNRHWYSSIPTKEQLDRGNAQFVNSIVIRLSRIAHYIHCFYASTNVPVNDR